MDQKKAINIIKRYIGCHEHECTGFCKNCEYYVDPDDLLESLYFIVKKDGDKK